MYKRWDNPEAWSAQRLHLDLLADPRLDSEGGETGVYFKFEFMEEAPVPDSEHYWFRVGRILDFDERQKFDTFLDEKDDELLKRNCRAVSERRSNETSTVCTTRFTSRKSSRTARNGSGLRSGARHLRSSERGWNEAE